MSETILPQIGRWYFSYDDGKAVLGRVCFVRVLELISFDKAPEDLREDWRKAVTQASYLYAKSTPFFIKTQILSSDWLDASDPKPVVYFASMAGDGYYAFPRNGESRYDINLLLDIDGKLTNDLVEECREWTKEDYRMVPDVESDHERLYKDYDEWKKQFGHSNKGA
jgi:hypothetical protein